MMESTSSIDELSKEQIHQRCLQLERELEKQTTERTSWIEALAEVLATDQGMTSSLTKGLQFIVKALGADGGYIHVTDNTKHRLTLRACVGLPKPAQAELKTIHEGENVPGQVLQKAEPLIATKITQISDLSGKVTQEENRMLHAGFPLKWQNRVLGTLTLVSRNQRTFSEENVAFLKAFSRFMGVVLWNLTLFHTVSQGKRQWEDAFDSISDLVVICDRDFRIVKTNRAILERFWLPLEDAIGRDCFGLLYDGNPFPVSRENLERMLRQGVTYYEEVTPGRQDGIFSIVVSPILTSGALAGSVHVIKEITHERLLEKDREELTRKISLFAPGTITIDGEGRIHSWNSGAHEALGYEEDEIRGRPIGLILPSGELKSVLGRLKASEGILDLDTVLIAKGERPVEVSLTLSAHSNQEANLGEVTIFIRRPYKANPAR